MPGGSKYFETCGRSHVKTYSIAHILMSSCFAKIERHENVAILPQVKVVYKN